MAIENYEVQALFAEPIFRADVGHAISAEQVEFIKNQKMVTNQVNLISENLYLFEEPEMLSIKEAIQEVLDLYAREVMGIPQKLYVTQSWSLTNEPEVGMHGHSHSNSMISGSLYFTDLPEPAAKNGIRPSQVVSANRTDSGRRQEEYLQRPDECHHAALPRGALVPIRFTAFR